LQKKNYKYNKIKYFLIKKCKMIFVYLWLYITFLFGIWAFYVVARMHIMKFKNFSSHIQPAINFLMIFLVVLSIIWLILIFNLWSSDSNYELKIDTKKSNGSYKQEIIWDEYY